MSEGTTTQWGRIDADGTVFLRTPDGEREIGSWHAGPPEEGLAFYERKYAEAEGQIALLEQRLAAEADPREVADLAHRAREILPQAKMIGDIGALDRRLAALVDRAHGNVERRRAARAEAREQATAAKQALVEEAERLATSNDWKGAGDRLRALIEDWKAIRGADRAAEAELWKRYASARDEFNRRRSEHFAALDKQRKESTARKERLIAEAEALSGSSEWTKTANRYRELLAQWKSAGRAGKDADDALWARFRAAQDAFFARRAASFAERDAELQRNLDARKALLAEAEALDPGRDLAVAQKRMRDIAQRWEQAGRVPRESAATLDQRLEAVQQRLREAADARRRGRRDVSASPLVIRLRESIEKLEGRVARARANGDERGAAEAEAALQTQRSWLAQAERR
jgi:hypothetical protein